MWLRRIDPATVVTDVLARTPAPASGALPSYAAADTGQRGAAAPPATDEGHARVDPYRYTAPPRS
jgi:MoxR-like ATPase